MNIYKNLPLLSPQMGAKKANELYNSLPPEVQNKIKYYVLEHPIAKNIKDEIERLNCDLTFKFKEKANGGINM